MIVRGKTVRDDDRYLYECPKCLGLQPTLHGSVSRGVRMHEVTFESVKSSWVDAIAYHDKSQTLYVRITEGGGYAFKHVPRVVFDELRAAESKGSYINAVVKPAYHYERVY
jgi:hypothetical protein